MPQNKLTTIAPDLARQMVRGHRAQQSTTKRPMNPIAGRVPPTKQVYARVTEVFTLESGEVRHAWEEVRWRHGTSDAAGQWGLEPDGITGDRVANYVVCGPDGTQALAVDDVVYVQRQDDPVSRLSVWVPVALSDLVGYFAVTASTQDGSNKRWTYTMRRHEKSAAGYAGWTEVSPADEITAYNDQEEDNGSSGLFGNGVDSANLTGTLDVKPAPTGKGVHRVYRVTAADGTTEYWFSHANAIDGGCE